MKFRIFFAVALLGVLPSMFLEVAQAQESIEIIGTLRFSTPSGSLSKYIRYGVGTSYTDTTDRAEVDVPAIPPIDLYAWFNRVCDGEFAGDPCQWEQDYRGIPDSVMEGVKTFGINYEIGLRNETGGTINMTILAPDWPAGVDSIHVEDAILPRAFTHTFTGPAEVELEDPLTTRLKVIVYYNLNVSSVNSRSETERGLAGLDISPNPTGENDVVVRSSFSLGDRLLVTDMLGQVVVETAVTGTVEGVRIKTEGIAPGNYVVARLNEKGEIVARDLLRIIR